MKKSHAKCHKRRNPINVMLYKSCHEGQGPKYKYGILWAGYQRENLLPKKSLWKLLKVGAA